MIAAGKDRKNRVFVVKYVLILAVAWTLAVGTSLTWNHLREQDGARSVASMTAKNQYNKDILYRRWVAGHGGVYVPITEANPPNPYLAHIENRDIETLSGLKLTLINPAYMTRQVHELLYETDDEKGHITSLNPIRPANAADPWEKLALESFEQGEQEYKSLVNIEGETYLRYMHVMITEQGCLKCHAEQGYEEGDIRGGISVSVPMAPYFEIARKKLIVLGTGHIVLWLLGLTGLVFGMRRTEWQVTRLREAEEALRVSATKAAQLDGIHKTVATLAHEINNPLTGVIGNLQYARDAGSNETMTAEVLNETLDAAQRIRNAVDKLSSIKDPSYRPYVGNQEIIDIRDEP